MRIQFAATLLLASTAYAALTITSPAINQCQDATFTISGAVGDVQLTVLPSDNPCDHDGLVVQGGFQNGGATLLDVNIPAGTSVVVVADDASGNEAWSQTIVVGGSSTDCAASASGGNSAPTTTTTHSTTATAPVNVAGASYTPPTPDSTSTSGATSLKASFGLGAVVAIAGLVFNA